MEDHSTSDDSLSAVMSMDLHPTPSMASVPRNDDSFCAAEFEAQIRKSNVRFTDFENSIGNYWSSIGDQNYSIPDKLRCTRVGKFVSQRNKYRKKGDVTPLLTHIEKKLRNASNSGKVDDVSRIIESTPGLDLNAADDKRRTALHFSAAKGADDIVHCLLKNGADPNVKDQSGNSPLHLAACTNHIRVVTLLLHFGGDAGALDKAGKTPLHLALSHLKLFQLQSEGRIVEFDKRKTEVREIANLLKEFLQQKGSQDEREQMTVMIEKIANSTTNLEVDEVGELLTNFTKMALDSGFGKS